MAAYTKDNGAIVEKVATVNSLVSMVLYMRVIGKMEIIMEVVDLQRLEERYTRAHLRMVNLCLDLYVYENSS